MMSNKKRRKLYVNDLDCNLESLCWSDSNSDSDVFRILVRSIYKFTDCSCTRLLIYQVKMIISAFIDGEDSFFLLETSSDGIKYYRYSNDANLSMNFVPMAEDNAYLLTFSAGVEKQ